jgi:hypothetical protein
MNVKNKKEFGVENCCRVNKTICKWVGLLWAWMLCLLHQRVVAYKACPQLTVLTYLWLIRHIYWRCAEGARLISTTPPSRVREGRNCANSSVENLHNSLSCLWPLLWQAVSQSQKIKRRDTKIKWRSTGWYRGFAVSEQRLTSRAHSTDAARCPVASVRAYRTVGSLFEENCSLSLQGFDDGYFMFWRPLLCWTLPIIEVQLEHGVSEVFFYSSGAWYQIG